MREGGAVRQSGAMVVVIIVLVSKPPHVCMQTTRLLLTGTSRYVELEFSEMVIIVGTNSGCVYQFGVGLRGFQKIGRRMSYAC